MAIGKLGSFVEFEDYNKVGCCCLLLWWKLLLRLFLFLLLLLLLLQSLPIGW